MDTANGPQVLRRINASAVLAVLRARPTIPARVADLMAATGLSRPAVTRAVTHLVAGGLAEYVGPGDGPQMGRPAQLVRFRAGLGVVAGIDVGPHKILTVLADLTGEIRSELRTAAPPGATGPEVLAAVRRSLRLALDAAGVDAADLWSVCVGTPGIIDHERGEVRIAPSIPGWAGLPVVPSLREELGCPVAVDNDVNLSVLAERWRGAATDTDTLVFVQWGERIGVGIVIGGQPYRGVSAAAGELGFAELTGDPASPPAKLTEGLGPFERLVGAAAIRELGHLDPAELFAATASGDLAAAAVMDTIAARFARGLAALVLILDPGVVVIGGGLSHGGTPLLTAVRRHLAERVLVPTDVRLSVLGDRAVAIGAVRQALDLAESRLTPA